MPFVYTPDKSVCLKWSTWTSWLCDLLGLEWQSLLDPVCFSQPPLRLCSSLWTAAEHSDPTSTEPPTPDLCAPRPHLRNKTTPTLPSTVFFWVSRTFLGSLSVSVQKMAPLLCHPNLWKENDDLWLAQSNTGPVQRKFLPGGTGKVWIIPSDSLSC